MKTFDAQTVKIFIALRQIRLFITLRYGIRLSQYEYREYREVGMVQDKGCK